MRYKQGADQAFAPSYEADPTNMGGYNSYPDATDPEGGYSQPPFTGQPGQPPQSGTMPEAEPMSYQQQPWLSGWFWGLWEGYVYIYVYFSFFYLFFLFSLIYLPIYMYLLFCYIFKSPQLSVLISNHCKRCFGEMKYGKHFAGILKVLFRKRESNLENWNHIAHH